MDDKVTLADPFGNKVWLRDDLLGITITDVNYSLRVGKDYLPKLIKELIKIERRKDE